MTEPLISDGLASSIREQIGHEFLNSHIYLYVAGFLKNKGLDNLAKIFEEQYDEERKHGKIFFDLLTDLNTSVIIPAINACEMEIVSILDVAQLYLDREILTTKSLKEIRDLAMEDGNAVVEEKLRYMIGLQQNEYSESTSFMDSAELCGDDWWKVKVWNDSLG